MATAHIVTPPDGPAVGRAEPSEEAFAAGLRDAAYESLGGVATSLAFAYVLWTAVAGLRVGFQAGWTLILLVGIVTAGGMVGVRVAFDRGLMPRRYAHALLGIVLATAIVHALLRWCLFGGTQETGQLVLVLFVVGILCLSGRWLVALLAMGVVGWAVLGWCINAPWPEPYISVFLLSAPAIAFLLRRMRVGILRRTFAEILKREAAYEHTLKQSEEELRVLFDSSTDLIQSVAPDGRFIRVNPRWRETLGYTADEVLNLKIRDIIHPDSLAHCQEVFKNLIRTGETAESVEATFVTKDGRAITVEGNVSCRLAAGRPVVMSAIFRDVTERRRAEEYLRRAKDAAEEANRARRDLVLSISHDLRIPLNAIYGYRDILLETELTTEQRDLLGRIESAAATLLTFVNDLLEFSRMEAGKLKLRPREFRVRDFLKNSLDALAQQAGSKRLCLLSETAEDVPETLVGDEDLLRRIVTNLVANAVKFTEAGYVMVRAALAGDGAQSIVVRFEVSDTGIGLAPEDQRRVFEAFARLNSHHRGSGLGLAICKQIVELLGGEIGVESEPGRGSTFWFTAPLTRVSVGREPAVGRFTD